MSWASSRCRSGDPARHLSLTPVTCWWDRPLCVFLHWILGRGSKRTRHGRPSSLRQSDFLPRRMHTSRVGGRESRLGGCNELCSRGKATHRSSRVWHWDYILASWAAYRLLTGQSPALSMVRCQIEAKRLASSRRFGLIDFPRFCWVVMRPDGSRQVTSYLFRHRRHCF